MNQPHPNHRSPSTLPEELRQPEVPAHVRSWIADVTGTSVRVVEALDGASSAAIHRIDLVDGEQVVVRRYVWRGYLDAEPDAPKREVEALRFARRHGLPVPELIAADVTGASIGDGVPVVLTTLVAGRPVAVPDLERLAETAATIHGVDPTGYPHDHFPWCVDEMTAPPAGTNQPGLWERALELWHAGPPGHPVAFVHRDFHPGNVLWSDGKLSGVVDWANACRGPAGCDIAHCRANLRNLADPETADRFVDIYASLTGVALDPFWIMAGHLEHNPRHWTAERLAADEPDLERAVRALTAGPVP
jgi:aminoglycoside phosphotransferase (APT) family kinase protein